MSQWVIQHVNPLCLGFFLGIICGCFGTMAAVTRRYILTKVEE